MAIGGFATVDDEGLVGGGSYVRYGVMGVALEGIGGDRTVAITEAVADAVCKVGDEKPPGGGTGAW